MMTAVMFADLVGYSKKSVTDQMVVKEALRDFLQTVLASFAPGSHIVMDTGDGAAVAFLADPEHALFFSMCLRRNIKAAAGQGRLRPEDLRLGINLGPVRWVVDVNGRPNLVGEGMNSAERVMSFATPGETTVSRSFRDAVSCLHDSYQQLFEPMGQRADKHGRQHEVFRLGASLLALQAATASLESAPSFGARDAPDTGHESLVTTSEARQHSSGRRSNFMIAAVVILLVAIGVGAWSFRGLGERPPAEIQPAPIAAKAAAETTVLEPIYKPESPVPAAPGETVRETGASAADHDLNAVPARSSEGPVLRDEVPLAANSASEPATMQRAAAKPAKSTRAAPGTTASARCTFLLQRAALGEGLSAREQEEFKTSCR